MGGALAKGQLGWVIRAVTGVMVWGFVLMGGFGGWGGVVDLAARRAGVVGAC